MIDCFIYYMRHFLVNDFLLMTFFSLEMIFDETILLIEHYNR